MKTKKEMDVRMELEKARKAAGGLERNGLSTNIEAYWEVCCGNVLLAEENASNGTRQWENASLAMELLDIAAYLEGYDHMLNNLHSALSRMAGITYGHPRLKLKLLELDLLVLRRIESLHGHDLSAADDTMSEISMYRSNIALADKGEPESIARNGHLRHDPVEWTAAYESVIDEAERKIESCLEDHPRGMGFCFEYWSTKARVLREDYGIAWRSPAQMNPGVIFD